MEEFKIPNHVAIILDGNGRWAKERGRTRSYGHLQGFNNLKKIAKYIFKKNVKVLSVFAFSTENFKRSKEEIEFLMGLFVKKFKELESLKDVKIVFSGIRAYPLPKEVINAINELEDKTKKYNKHIFNICINYGGQNEIIDACKKISTDILDNKIKIDNINQELFNKYLYNDLPPIDLLIRTSGELRISNFMLWQLAYAEFYFPSTYFPDFKEKDFDEALLIYNNRDRRFGGIKEKGQ